MNEESQIPSIEPELEARIIALVLGEASDFESEELNRLMEHRPELAAFRLRMEKVHGLLREAGEGEFEAPGRQPKERSSEACQELRPPTENGAESLDDFRYGAVSEHAAADDWKLPADKRNAVLAVISGEATVQQATQADVSSVPVRIVGKRRFLRSLASGAAVACVVGIGAMAMFTFTAQEDAASEDFAGAAWDAREPLSGGTDVMFELDGDLLADAWQSGPVLPSPTRRQFSWFSEVDGKKSELALSEIQDTLDSRSTPPGDSNLADDVQYFEDNDFTVPGEAIVRHETGEPERFGRSSSAKSKAKAPKVAEPPELIARSDGGWMYKGLRDQDRNGKGRVDSQSHDLLDSIISVNPPRDDFRESLAGLAIPSVSNNDAGIAGALVWDKDNVDSYQRPEDVSDLGATIHSGLMRRSEISRSFEDDDLARLSPRIIIEEDEESIVSGMAQGLDAENQTLSLADAAESKEVLDGFSSFTTRDFGAQTSGPGQGQVQKRGVAGREYFRKRKVSPADERSVEGERLQRGTQWMEYADVADATAPVDGTANSLFGRGGRQLGRTTGGGSFGGGGGFDGIQPNVESKNEIVAGGKRLGEGGGGDTGPAVLNEMAAAQALIASEKAKLGEQIALIEDLKANNGDDSLRMLNGVEESLAQVGAGFSIENRRSSERVETYGIQLPVPITGAVMPAWTGESAAPYTVGQPVQVESADRSLPGAGRPSLSFSTRSALDNKDVASTWGFRPLKKQQRVESQRKPGGLGVAKEELDVRFRYVAPTLTDGSGAMKRPAVKRITPSAGLAEKSAADEAFSTFSLHVSDVSFKLALAALGKGEWPEAAKVRIEEFVNAFDYGDPMPCNGEKVACAVEQSIHPFVQQRNLLRVSMRTAAAGRASSTPLRLTFLLDNSGSMERTDRQQTVRRAFAMLAQQLTPIDQVTLISFARQPRLLADKIDGAEAEKLVQLIDQIPSEGGTNIEAALQLAFEKAREQQTPNAQNRIILLTDGAVNLGNANPESLSQMVTTMRNAGVAFDAAGISAEGLNDEVLEALTRKGDGRYYLLDSVESADDGFARQIAGALRPSAKNVKVQIEFNPKRVGNYKLLGFEKHVLKKEDFRNDKVDAAEMAAAEAGVAMYQFEAKPDGEGDVGSVSVRFQDLSTGQMVENRWPIPYEADAPRPDQAAPSLRIATSAALLAAKLRGEPLGESVDLQTLSHLVSGLPDQERNDTRVQQLQQMIEQARQLSGK